MDVEALWWLSLAIGAVVVAVVAVLLGLIIAAARDIDRHAEDIWVVGKEIAGNTVSIWMLEQTNAHLRRVEEAAGGLRRTLGSIDEKLGSPGRPGEGAR